MDWTRLLTEFARAHPVMVAVNLFMVMLVPVNEIILPQWYGLLISAFQGRKPLTRIFVVVACLVIVTRMSSYIIEPMDVRFTTELHSFVRDRALKALLIVSETRGALHNGDIIASLTKLPICVETILGVWRTTIIPAMLGFLFAGLYLSQHDMFLCILISAVVVVYLIMILAIPRACATESLKRDESYNQIIEQIDDVLLNVVSVYSQGQQEQERANVRERGKEYGKRYITTVKCYLPAYMAVTAASMAFVCVYLYRTHTLMLRRTIDTATLVTIMFIMMFSLNSLSRATGIIRPLTMQYGVLAGSIKILEGDEETDAETDADHQTHLPDQEELSGTGIELRDVSFNYGSHPVLQSISIDFPAGLTTVLWGPVGSGKSTMLKLLLRYKKPRSGEIFLWGTPYSDINAEEVRRTISYVPQSAVLFDRSIAENMRYGTSASDSEVASMATRLGLGAAGSMHRELSEPAGKGGTLVSGGQRQLILVARALLSGSRVLILDEPTASLDEESRGMLMRCLVTLRQEDFTIIIVTHDARLIEIADRVLRLDDGNVA